MLSVYLYSLLLRNMYVKVLTVAKASAGEDDTFGCFFGLCYGSIYFDLRGTHRSVDMVVMLVWQSLCIHIKKRKPIKDVLAYVTNGQPPGKEGLKAPEVPLFSEPSGLRQAPPFPATPSSPDEYRIVTPWSPSLAYSAHCLSA